MNKLKYMMEDKHKLMYEMKKKKKDILFWSITVVLTIFIFLFISSKDFSFFLVLSSITQTFAFSIILMKVTNYSTCSGLSSNTLICYAILLFARLTSTMFFSGYLPTDSAGTWLYQLADVISLLICGLLIYQIFYRYRETSDVMLDKKLPWYYLVIPTYIFALIFRSNLNYNKFADTNWAFSNYLEAFAILPQIVLFWVKKGQIESFTSHYVALCGLAKVFSLIFWFDTYEELNTSDTIFTQFSGQCIIGAQFLQLIIMADYYYLYFKSLLKGQAINTLDI